ncbi:hypothetical protein FSP39_021598 [Pinctada imbricata]|uniref:2'-phosphotransferase n=1 Tax=Pinctada imbricata TaxID=66713 RepID=A0AA88XLP3_PINIB|nr:hypothetical protein FSP39_021598 [Pinctada imbricata]
MDHKQLSRRLAFALRHDSQLPVDENGWISIRELRKCQQFRFIHADILYDIISTCNKQRLEMSIDGRCVRATSGHTINIRVETLLTPIWDPSIVPYCAHATRMEVLPKIKLYGLHRMKRHYVHFAPHPSALRQPAEAIIHLDVEKYMRRNPGKLSFTANGTIVTLGNKFGYVKPCFFKRIELID